MNPYYESIALLPVIGIARESARGERHRASRRLRSPRAFAFPCPSPSPLALSSFHASTEARLFPFPRSALGRAVRDVSPTDVRRA